MLYVITHLLHRKYPASDNYYFRVFKIAADSEQAAIHQFIASNTVLPEDYAFIDKTPVNGNTTHQHRDDLISAEHYRLVTQNAFSDRTKFRRINAP
jgi:maltooligosyltrehalose synthase